MTKASSGRASFGSSGKFYARPPYEQLIISMLCNESVCKFHASFHSDLSCILRGSAAQLEFLFITL